MTESSSTMSRLSWRRAICAASRSLAPSSFASARSSAALASLRRCALSGVFASPFAVRASHSRRAFSTLSVAASTSSRACSRVWRVAVISLQTSRRFPMSWRKIGSTVSLRCTCESALVKPSMLVRCGSMNVVHCFSMAPFSASTASRFLPKPSVHVSVSSAMVRSRPISALSAASRSLASRNLAASSATAAARSRSRCSTSGSTAGGCSSVAAAALASASFCCCASFSRATFQSAIAATEGLRSMVWRASKSACSTVSMAREDLTASGGSEDSAARCPWRKPLPASQAAALATPVAAWTSALTSGGDGDVSADVVAEDALSPAGCAATGTVPTQMIARHSNASREHRNFIQSSPTASQI